MFALQTQGQRQPEPASRPRSRFCPAACRSYRLVFLVSPQLEIYISEGTHSTEEDSECFYSHFKFVEAVGADLLLWQQYMSPTLVLQRC